MGDYLVQAIIFLAGIIIELYTSTLSLSRQKNVLRVLAGLLIAVGLVWTGYQLAKSESTPATPVDGPTVTDIPNREPTKPTNTLPPQPTAWNNTDGRGIWINSHPPGAQVYIIPARVELHDLKVEDVQTSENLVGTTPLSLDLSSDNYYVLTRFPAELFDNLGIELPTYSSPGFEEAFPSDGSQIFVTSFTDGEHLKELARVYNLRIERGLTEALISLALPLPMNQRVATSPAIYPTLATVELLPSSYTVNKVGMRNAIERDLTEYNLTSIINAEMVSEMIEVILRTGKVVLDTDTVRIIIQMNGLDRSDFTVTIFK